MAARTSFVLVTLLFTRIICWVLRNGSTPALMSTEATRHETTPRRFSIVALIQCLCLRALRNNPIPYLLSATWTMSMNIFEDREGLAGEERRTAGSES